MAQNCKALGIGPNCEHSEKGDGRKAQCLEEERMKCLGKLNMCIGTVKKEEGLTYVYYTALDGSSHGYMMRKGFSSENAGYESAKNQGKGIAQCFAEVDCFFGRCYCTSTVCDGPCQNDPGGIGGLPIDKKKIDSQNNNTGANGPNLSGELLITHSAYGVPIPLVYGSQIVSGNIIYVSTPRTFNIYQTKESVPDYTNQSPTTYDIFANQTTKNPPVAGQKLITSKATSYSVVDFAIGLTAGEIKDIGRIWFNDTLIYDNRIKAGGLPPDANSNLGTTTDPTAFGLTSYDPALTRTKITLFNGSEDQVPTEAGQFAVGYRGLAYIFIENFNLATISGIPEFRVEIINSATNAKSFVTKTFNTDIDTTFYVNPEYGTVLVGGDSTVYSVDPFTLESARTNDAPLLAASTIRYIDTRYIVQDVDNKLALYNPATGVTLPYSAVAHPHGINKFNSVAFTALDKSTFKPATYLASLDASTSKLFVASFINDVYYAPSVLNTFTSPVNGEMITLKVLDRLTGVASGVPVSESLLVAVSKSLTGVYVYGSSLLKTPTINAYTPGPMVPTAVITASDLGGVPFDVIDVTQLPLTSELLIIVKTQGKESGYGVKLNPFTGVYTVVPLTSTPLRTNGYYPYSGLVFKWIGQDAKVYALELDSMSMKTGATLDAPEVVGTQFYNEQEDSLTYVGENQTLTKVYISRTVPIPTSVGSALADMCSRVGLEASDADFSGISFPLAGYVINTAATLKTVYDQFTIYYPILFSEAGGKLTATTKAQGAPYIIGDDSFASGGNNGAAISVFNVDTFTQIEYVSLSYARADQGYYISSQSLKRPAFLANNELNDFQNVAYAYPFVLTDIEARRISERLIFESAIEPNTAEIYVGIDTIGVTPGTFIEARKGDISFIGMVKDLVEEPGVRSKLLVTATEALIYNEDATLTAVPDPTGVNVDPTLPSSLKLLPLTFEIPSPYGNSDEDLAVRASRIFYTCADPRAAYPLDVFSNGTKIDTIPSAPLLGVLTNLPHYSSSLFTVDEDSVLTIQFYSEVGTRFNTPATLANLLAEPSRNLLIVGRELIQFKSAVVAPDGLTVAFSGLLRGLRNTDYAADDHELGEPCALYEDATIRSTTVNTYTTTSIYLSLGFKPSAAAQVIPLETNTPVTYTSFKAPIVNHVRRRRSGLTNPTTIFSFLARTSLTNELQENSFINDVDNTAAGLAQHTLVYILKGAYSEAGFKNFLAGNDPDYAYGSMTIIPAATGNQSSVSLIDGTPIFTQLQVDSIDPSTSQLDVVIMQENTFSNGNPAVGGESANFDYQYGFFEAFRFAENDMRARPLRLGVAA